MQMGRNFECIQHELARNLKRPEVKNIVVAGIRPLWPDCPPPAPARDEKMPWVLCHGEKKLIQVCSAGDPKKEIPLPTVKTKSPALKQRANSQKTSKIKTQLKNFKKS